MDRTALLNGSLQQAAGSKRTGTTGAGRILQLVHAFAAAGVPIVAAWLVLNVFDPELAHAAARGWWKGEDPGAFAGGIIQRAYCDIAYYVEGNFGGLLAAAAGVMGLGYAAFGSMDRMASFLVVVIGASTLTAMVSLYFGRFGCEGPYSPRTSRSIEGLQTDAADRIFSRSAVDLALGGESRDPGDTSGLIADIPDDAASPAASTEEESAGSDPFDF